jgi:hypothetical protein
VGEELGLELLTLIPLALAMLGPAVVLIVPEHTSTSRLASVMRRVAAVLVLVAAALLAGAVLAEHFSSLTPA